MDEPVAPADPASSPAPKRAPGRPKGINETRKRVLSPAAIRANRTRNYKHGRRAKVVTVAEARIAQLRKIHPEAPEILAAALEAINGGNLDDVNKLGARAFTEAELIRRDTVDRIRQDGVTVEDQILNNDGAAIGVRTKAHPLFEPMTKLYAILGYTAPDMQMTRKSRGEGDKDAAITAMLKRRALLLSADKNRMLPPAKDDAIESEVVD